MIDNILNNLNQEQKQSVETTEGYIRLVAGAGTGKTKALIHRYAYLVDVLGVSTANVLCVTFTNKAANEMKQRVRAMLGDIDLGYICTFHGFCVQVLREDIHAIHYPKNFMIMDSEDTEVILKNIYEIGNISTRSYTFASAKNDIAQAKGLGKHIPYLLDFDIKELLKEFMDEKDITRKVFLGYLYEQKKCFGLDFNDLITLTFHILQSNLEKKEKWQKRMMYIMVDEFQDVSRRQYALVDMLSEYHKNLFIVGDPDQTIYTWRGAKIEYFLDFDKKHTDTQTIFLNQNYRSSTRILEVSNSLIKKNEKRIEKELFAVKKDGGKTAYFHAKSNKLEAEWITKNIKSLIEKGIDYSQISILYRSHFVSRSIEEELIKEKIPYVLYSGVEFYKRKEIKDVLSYLRMVIYADDLSFLRVINEPKRNIGKKRIAFLQEYANNNNCTLYNALKFNMDEPMIVDSNADEFVKIIDKYSKTYNQMNISDVLIALLDESGYEAMLRQSGEQDRLDNLSELKQSIFEFEKTSGEENILEEYIQSIALFSNIDVVENKSKVKLMTIHTAKGLEFPHVFVCGLNEGIFPSSHTKTIEMLEEERRLAYVAYTRAENALYLSDSEGFNYDRTFRFPSRFILNVDREYIEYVVELDEVIISEAKAYIKRHENKLTFPGSNLDIGDLVEHKAFGKGTIVNMDIEAGAYTIKFDKLDTERNMGLKSPLVKIDI